MVYTNTWNAAFEAIPPDTGENHSLGANRIRALKNAIRERLAKDHYMDVAGNDTDHGEHNQITFHAAIATPANIANKSFLYPKTANGKIELHYLDSANQECQITANGVLNESAVQIPAGTNMLIYADTAPTGWTIDDTMDDKLVFVTKGSNANGETGGQAHSTGAWAITGISVANHVDHNHSMQGHIHTLATVINPAGVPDTAKPVVVSSNRLCLHGTIGSAQQARDYTGGPSSANTGGANATLTHTANQAGTWRPAAYNFIICSKD